MYKKKQRLLALSICLMDCLIAAGCFFLAGLLRYRSPEEFLDYVDFTEALTIIVFVTIAFFYILSFDDGFITRGYLKEFNRTLFFNICIFASLTLYTFVTKNNVAFSRLTLGYFFVLSTVVMYSAHVIAKLFARKGISQNRMLYRHILLVSDQASAEGAVRKAKQNLMFRYTLVGIAITDTDMQGQKINGIPIVATQENLISYTTAHVVDEVLITANALEERALKHIILDFEMMGIPVNLEIRIVQTGINDVKQVYPYNGFDVISFSTRLYDTGMLAIKRGIDIMGGLVGILLCTLLSIFVIPAILVNSRGPIFFKQTRMGLNGRPFTIYKFRSMYADAEKRKKDLMAQNEAKGPMFKIKRDPRVTRVGYFLRKSSIDEFPQFYNVLKGDMSLVGTRPPTEEEYLQYTHIQKKRLCFKPGITGLWQVSGRNKIVDFEEVVRLDLSYIDNWSISLDIKILLKTIKVVFTQGGAY